MEYEICFGESAFLIEEVVKEMIINGYEPQGGVCRAELGFYQAMIKKEYTKQK